MIRICAQPHEVPENTDASCGRAPGRYVQVSVSDDGSGMLVVEDEPMVRELVVRILRQHGYRVLQAGDGKQATDILGQAKHTIDLLVLDVVLPEMGGFAVYDFAAQIKPEVAVLFVSGYPEQSSQERSIRERGLEIIAKPYSPTTLLRHVRRLLDGRTASGSSNCPSES